MRSAASRQKAEGRASDPRSHQQRAGQLVRLASRISRTVPVRHVVLGERRTLCLERGRS
jgi:hypothetical protein